MKFSPGVLQWRCWACWVSTSLVAFNNLSHVRMYFSWAPSVARAMSRAARASLEVSPTLSRFLWMSQNPYSPLSFSSQCFCLCKWSRTYWPYTSLREHHQWLHLFFKRSALACGTIVLVSCRFLGLWVHLAFLATDWCWHAQLTYAVCNYSATFSKSTCDQLVVV